MPGGQWSLNGCAGVQLGNREDMPWSAGFEAGWRVDAGVVRGRSDRFGLLPIYYYSDAERFGIASSWVALQQAFGLVELDHDALACYFYAGLYPGDDTPFRGIRRVPPDSGFQWADGQFTITGLSTPSRGLSGLSYDDAVDAYGARMNEVVGLFADHAPQGTAVLLSGGQDSRHILFALLAGGRRPDRVLTQRQPPSFSVQDVAVASLVCERLGLSHTLVDADSRLVAIEREKNALIGMDTINHAWLLSLRRWMGDHAVPAFFDGLAGDVLSGSRYLTPERVRTWREGDALGFAQQFCFRSAYIEKLARPEFARLWTRERAVARIAREAARYLDCPNPHNHFGLARARRVIGPALWPMLGQGREVLLPFLHPRVHEVLIDLPMEYSLGRALHRDAIARTYPKWADLPYHCPSAPQAPEPWSMRSDLMLAALNLGGTFRNRQFMRNGFLLSRAANAVRHLGAYDHTMRWMTSAIYLEQLEALIAPFLDGS